MLVVAVDPGLGVKSACGVVAFDGTTGRIIAATKLAPPPLSNMTLPQKLSMFAKLFGCELDLLGNPRTFLFAIEYFVMKGKSGESLQRLVGAIYSQLPSECTVMEVQNTKVKKVVGGRGDDDKAAVGDGVAKWFESRDKKSMRYIVGLYNNQEWDLLDAFAIGITAYEEHMKCNTQVKSP